MKRLTVHFSGRVQGVGFRYTAQRMARQYPITGYVKNLSDGRVEMVVEGDDQHVDGFIEAVQCSMASYIHDRQIMASPGLPQYTTFDIDF
jgi:acylphosphatase